MTVALFFNDFAGMHAETVPFSKVNLSWLCNKLGVKNDNPHNALPDALAAIKCYRKLTILGLQGVGMYTATNLNDLNLSNDA